MDLLSFHKKKNVKKKTLNSSIRSERLINMSNLLPLFSRKLIPVDKASARIFDHSLTGKPGERTGRDQLLRKGRIGGAITRW